MRTEPFNKL